MAGVMGAVLHSQRSRLEAIEAMSSDVDSQLNYNQNTVNNCCECLNNVTYLTASFQDSLSCISDLILLSVQQEWHLAF